MSGLPDTVRVKSSIFSPVAPIAAEAIRAAVRERNEARAELAEVRELLLEYAVDAHGEHPHEVKRYFQRHPMPKQAPLAPVKRKTMADWAEEVVW